MLYYNCQKDKGERKMTERNVLDVRELYVFSKRGGRLTKMVSGKGKGLLGMYALQNTTKGSVAVMVFENDHQIERVYIGSEGCPKVIYNDKNGWWLNSLDEYIKDETHIDINRLVNDCEGM